MKTASSAAAIAAASLIAATAFAQQVVKPAVAQYGVDIGTRNMSIPGMPAGGMAAMMMPGGMGGGPTKELYLGLRSTQKASAPEADHDIPPGMGDGQGAAAAARRRRRAPGAARPTRNDRRKSRRRGCSCTGAAAIRSVPGQPKIADTEKMSLAQFGEALRGRSPPGPVGRARNAQLRWPNEREPKPVPATASIKGDQFVHGSATPDIRFTIGERQDFLAPFEATAKGAFPGPFALSWKPIANAQGYFLQAIGHRESDGRDDHLDRRANCRTPAGD